MVAFFNALNSIDNAFLRSLSPAFIALTISALTTSTFVIIKASISFIPASNDTIGQNHFQVLLHLVSTFTGGIAENTAE